MVSRFGSLLIDLNSVSSDSMRLPFVGSIAVLGILQILIWFACILFVAVSMKAFGYPETASLSDFPPYAVFVRHYGLLLPLVPGSWLIWATWDWELNESSGISLKVHNIIGCLGLVLTFYLATCFIFAANPSRRGPIQAVDDPSY